MTVVEPSRLARLGRIFTRACRRAIPAIVMLSLFLAATFRLTL